MLWMQSWPDTEPSHSTQTGSHLTACHCLWHLDLHWPVQSNCSRGQIQGTPSWAANSNLRPPARQEPEGWEGPDGRNGRCPDLTCRFLDAYTFWYQPAASKAVPSRQDATSWGQHGDHTSKSQGDGRAMINIIPAPSLYYRTFFASTVILECSALTHEPPLP